MSISPRVSVICPVFNAELYLESAMRSVLEQNYTDIELVISDDCSTDASRRIACEVAAAYPHRRVILQFNDKNLGITNNCNLALSLCTGELICLFAGDDLMYQDKITHQVDAFQANPSASLCYHGTDLIDDEGRRIAVWEDTNGRYRNATDIIRRGGIPYASSMMVRATAVPSWGYDSAVATVSDWLFLIEVTLAGGLIQVPGVYGAYRRHGHGTSRRTFDLLSETLKTLDIVNERYGGADLKAACKSGRRRYLLGEISRLALAGDGPKLMKLRSEFARGDVVIAGLSTAAALFTSMQLHRLDLVRRAYNRLARNLKS